MVALVVGAALAHTPLRDARAALTSHPFAVVDESQPDEPDYDLVFTRSDARRLRRTGANRFAYAGPAYDAQTDETLAVRFTLTSRGRIVRFRGPPADTSQPSFPIRASFYYAWYPEAWSRGSVYPYTRFHPSLDFYSATDASIERRQTDSMLYAHLNAGIYSWWGRGTDTDVRFWRYLAVARTTPLRWAVYYEHEGYADPSIDRIRADLEYIRDFYAYRPAYLKVSGRFVVFVYGDAGELVRHRRAVARGGRRHRRLPRHEGVRRVCLLSRATGRVAPVLRQPRREYTVTSAFMISPGFDEAREPAPRLPRDLDRWRRDIADMVASDAPWQLVISFNEWPEGTAVGEASEWQSPSGYGAYLNALHNAVH
jgi:hypothetical protein